MPTPHDIRDEPAYAHLREILQQLAALEPTGMDAREAVAAIRRRLRAALEQLEALEPGARTYPVDETRRPLRILATLAPRRESPPDVPTYALKCPDCNSEDALFAVYDDGNARCVECRQTFAVQLRTTPAEFRA